MALKVSEQESINLKLREELKEKELLVALSKDQEGKIRSANEKLTNVLQEKEILETSVAEITRIAAERKENCDELEEKLKISDEKISKTDALLSQALSNNSDLEQKLKSMEALSSEVSQLKSALIVAEEEEKDSARKMQEYQEKVTKLESSLNQSSARISELEEDLRTALQRGAEHEDLGNVSTQRCLELQGLLQTSQSKLEIAEEKLKDLEAFQVKNSSLEAALSVAIGEKKALEETLNGYSVKITESEERLVKQAREIEEVTTRSRELEAMQKHSELSIQKAMEELRTRDAEAKSLAEKLRLYEEKLAVASAHSFSLKKDLDQSSMENELLADTNNQLKIKIQDLNAEKETATRQTEEAAKRFELRDIEAKDMLAKLKAQEDLLKEHRREIQEASEVANTRKMKLEESLLKLKTFEDTIKELEKENGSLAERFQAMFSALEAEKDQAAKELHASKASIKELRNKLTSERERLRSKVEKVAELTSKLHGHETKASDRDLEDKKATQLRQKEAVSQKHSELEATLKKSQEELEAKTSMIVHLESLVKDLEKKVQLADAKSKETETKAKEEVEVKSRDIDLSFTTQKQRSPSHSSSSGNVTTTQKAGTSHLMTLKIVLGVAILSVIIGILLGKNY
ncbi:hypothetical protein Rs2_00033 [Raphanus sativus]|nr:hypothetical protein Rs2_00033 [Raphanus sativus]